MAEEFLQGGVCWWNSPRNLFSSLASNDIGSFGWQSHDVNITEMKSVRSSDDSGCSAASDGSSSLVIQEHVQRPAGGSMAMDSSLHVIAAPDGWIQDLLRDSGRSEENYSDFLLDSSMNNYRPQINKNWDSNSKIFCQDSPIINTVKQGFGVEQQQPLDSLSSPTSYSLLQTLFDTDSQSLLDTDDYHKLNSNGFLPSLPPMMKQQQPWMNATSASLSNVRPTNFLPSPPSRFLPSSLTSHSIGAKHEQAKDLAAVVKKASNEPPSKRPRFETPSSLPTFKVRKEKLGDRITALQQLVSPFGKTDTASVLHEAIEYIRFLHDQVNALSTPYMKYGSPPLQRQQGADKSKEEEGLKKELKTRGLCLVPISSTFPLASETTADFWTPTFGGSFR